MLIEYEGITPNVHPSVFVAPGAMIIGDVTIGEESSIWFNSVLRGDLEPIRIGCRTNVQDGAVIHMDKEIPCLIGDDVTIGHGAILHSCTIGDGALIGMGAILLTGSVDWRKCRCRGWHACPRRTGDPTRCRCNGSPSKSAA